VIDLSRSAQDYLKAIYLEGEGDRAGVEPVVSTTSVADRLGVSAASVTNMLKKLDALGLVNHLPYRGAELTAQGLDAALEIVRHHRLLEAYLAESLSVPWEEVHAEAEVLEHVLSEQLEERISAHLGHPTSDPHGHPIPSRDGIVPATSEKRLWELAVGARVKVERVSDSLPEGLRYLREIGVLPGAGVEVVERGPVNGPLFVRIADSGDEVHALSRDIAEAVWVS
jgi:DtxR family transcriptional regulator, Mn-dependent transcriptional regulator